MNIHRHGDVYLIPIKAKIEGKTEKRAVLAYGEVTGHAHVIDHPHAKLTRDQNAVGLAKAELVRLGIIDENAIVTAALTVEGDASVPLTHEEHDTQHIQPGRYAVIIQREYSPAEIRRVAD